MASRDTSQKPFDRLLNIVGNIHIVIRSTKSIGGVTKVELGNLFKNFKTDIMGTIRSQIDVLNIKRKLEDEALTIFCPRCRKRHAAKKCALNNINICAICRGNHET